MTLNPWLIAAAFAASLAAGLGLYYTGYERGKHKAELTCAKADSEALAAGIDKWRKAAEAQRTQDAAARMADAAITAKALDGAKDVADRFAAMKIAVLKLAPTGNCKLSKEWTDAFNAAK